jgi:hypothetical protein
MKGYTGLSSIWTGIIDDLHNAHGVGYSSKAEKARRKKTNISRLRKDVRLE